jgi:prepilin-type processing-associated H-X9-DG protein
MSSVTRIIGSLVGVLALMGIGFIVGLISGPHLLPDLDLNVYELSPEGRVHGWGFLCAVGFGFMGATVALALSDHRRMSRSPSKRRPMSGLTILVGLLALAALPTLFEWSLVFGPRPAALRSHCINNLKSIALALYAYHEDFGCLPPAYIPDERGRPQHSWRVLILPYLDRAAFSGSSELRRLYDSYDFSETWDGPHNRTLAHRMPLVYGCGDDPARRNSTTSYLVITGDRSAFPHSRSIKLNDVRDGTANTITVIETANSGINWMEPKDYPIEELRFGPRVAVDRRIGGNHPGGANAGFADGSVRFLREQDFANETLKALATIDKGENMDHVRW